MITIKDIAEKANVSTATVSYVLNDSAQISGETRERVLKIVEELGYKRNNIAKSLRTNKSNTIGVIVEDMTVFNSPEIIDGINQYLEKKGFHIILSNLRLNKKIGNDYSKIDLIKDEIKEDIDVLLSRQIDGIIYVGGHTRDVTGIIDEIDKPVVYTYCYTTNSGDHFINYDDKMAAYQGTEHLIELGHKKIAVISGLINSLPSHDRLRGYQKALMDYNLSFNPDYIKTGDWEYDTGYEKSQEFFKDSNPPTAIFAFNDLMAAGVIDAAEAMGYIVPRDLSVIGFDNRDFSFFYKPKLTTIDLPLNKMGECSADILLKLIHSKKVERENIRLKCKIIRRESTLEI